MALKVDWTRNARKDIKKLSMRDAGGVRRTVQRLTDTGLGDFRHLRGVNPPTYRLRVGSWRVMIELEKDLIRVIRALHRSEAYKMSYWARQEVPGKDDMGDSENSEAQGELGEQHYVPTEIGTIECFGSLLLSTNSGTTNTSCHHWRNR